MQNEKYYKNFLNNNPYPRKLRDAGFIPDATSSAYVICQGRRLINFSSSDYLGLARHPHLIARSQEYAKRWGVGSSSSRLVAGNLALYETLESQLATAIGKPAALILGAGYQANISVLEALLDPQVLGDEALVFCDRYCHVSLLAMTQHVSRLQRFQHNDLNHLQKLLEKHANSTQPKFIIVESIYSMDGDQANLDELTAIAKQHQAMLYVDDAHAVGVYGKSGWGRATHHAEQIDVIMGTFSKALGSFGAYIACSNTVKEYLINKCRGLIYSTGPSPAVLGAIAGAIEILPQLDKARSELLEKARSLREFLSGLGLNVGNSDSHIVPWIVGEANQTLRMSQCLEEHGILAGTIRPPSVPAGQCRIRFCLSTAHSEEDLQMLKCAIQETVI